MTNGRSAGKIGTLVLDASALEALAAGFDAFAARCRSRTYAEEGIPAMLVIEDLRRDLHPRPTPRTGTEQDLLLAAALDLYGQLARHREKAPGAVDLAAALEVLAARSFFTAPLPDLPPEPSSGSR